MWELYTLLGSGFNKEYLLDETSEILRNVDSSKIKKVLRLLYTSIKISNPLDIALLLMRGLKENKFFEFQVLIENLNANRH